MKKEIIISVLFAVMIAVSFVNIAQLSKLTTELTRDAELAADAAQIEDWTAAEEHATRAFRIWKDHSAYTQLVLRHGVIEQGENAIIGLLTDIYSRDKGRVLGSAEAVRRSMESIATVEQVRIGSVL
ncbi:MAG: DUF4363 family protein [Oscillospiraceae bacterium]|jgi:hypothetical protein|nr:DUF4363 family protein [Oscillospiraceae bacterium]